MPRSLLIVINVIQEVIIAIHPILVLVVTLQNTIPPIVPTIFQRASLPIVSSAMANPIGRHQPGITMTCISPFSAANTKANGMIVVIVTPIPIITTYLLVLPATHNLLPMETTMEYPGINTTAMPVTTVTPTEKNDEKNI